MNETYVICTKLWPCITPDVLILNYALSETYYYYYLLYHFLISRDQVNSWGQTYSTLKRDGMGKLNLMDCMIVQYSLT